MVVERTIPPAIRAYVRLYARVTIRLPRRNPMRNRLFGLSAASLCIVLGAIGLTYAQQRTTTPNRKVFADSVTPITIQEGITPSGLTVNTSSARHKADTMELLFSLDIPP